MLARSCFQLHLGDEFYYLVFYGHSPVSFLQMLDGTRHKKRTAEAALSLYTKYGIKYQNHYQAYDGADYQTPFDSVENVICGFD